MNHPTRKVKLQPKIRIFLLLMSILCSAVLFFVPHEFFVLKSLAFLFMGITMGVQFAEQVDIWTDAEPSENGSNAQTQSPIQDATVRAQPQKDPL